MSKPSPTDFPHGVPAWLPPDDRQLHARMQELTARIPASVLAELRAIHDAGLGCAAHAEGQACCLADYLLSVDPPTRWLGADRAAWMIQEGREGELVYPPGGQS